MDVLKVENLGKRFGALEVLHDVSFAVKKGEYVALIGPNGAGKTTFMNLVSGVFHPTEGRVMVFGKDVSYMPIHKRAQFGVARSFQISRIFRELSVFQNISLALNGMRRSRYQIFKAAESYKEVTARAQFLLKSIGLWGKKDKVIGTLSYGEQRKMEFMLSLASEPKLLLLDEPSAGLAVADVPEFVNLIKEFAKGTTLLFVAHDMDVVFDLAERILVLNYGYIIADGSPEEIQHNPKVREIYLKR
jgi:branched-chain amino acid transport system ATP-binding protein